MKRGLVELLSSLSRVTRIEGNVHFHDLRHAGNTLAAPGASPRELMSRMGHSTPRAAMIYQHMANGRDREIADRLGAMIREAREKGQPPPRGT
ncbi:tyrosine-type recombinase/integrase [Streptomyces sp. NPDC048442]|uniref:tyrosine-type recombinase/integrase n=1 Tax=Streptomyces sp. NPDC048442 TaxID=3154823 RepID=UPI0034246BFE